MSSTSFLVRFLIAAASSAAGAGLIQAILTEAVGFRSSGIASAFSGLAFAAIFETLRSRIALGAYQSGPRTGLFQVLLVGLVLYVHTNSYGLLTDVFRVHPVLSWLQASTLSAIVLYAALRLVGPITSRSTSPRSLGFAIDRRRLIAFALLAVVVIVTRAMPTVKQFSVWNLAEMTRGDWGEMVKTATTLARTGNIADPYPHPTGPTAHVAPIYVSILASIYTVLGVSTAAGFWAQTLMTTAIAIGTMLMLPWLALHAGFSERVGWAAACFLTFVPIMVGGEIGGLFDQAMGALVFLIELALLIELQRNWRDPVVLAATAFFSGFMTLFSPSLTIGVGLAFACLLLLRSQERWNVVRSLVIIGATVAIFILPWSLRNTVVLGGFVPVRSNFGLELAIMNADGARGSFQLEPRHADFRHPIGGDESLAVARMGELAYMKSRRDEAVGWITSNPGEFARLTVMRARMFWFPDTSLSLLSSASMALIRTLLLGAISICVFMFAARALRTRDPAQLVLAAGAIGPSLLHILTHTEIRYRVPIHALTVLLAAELCFVLMLLAGQRWPVLNRAFAQLRSLVPSNGSRTP